MLRALPRSQLEVRAKKCTNERWRSTCLEARRADRYLRAAVSLKWLNSRPASQQLTHAPCIVCGGGTAAYCDGCLFRGQECGEPNPVPWALCTTCDSDGYLCHECTGYGYTKPQTEKLLRQRFPDVASRKRLLVTCVQQGDEVVWLDTPAQFANPGFADEEDQDGRGASQSARPSTEQRGPGTRSFVDTYSQWEQLRVQHYRTLGDDGPPSPGSTDLPAAARGPWPSQ